MDAKTFERELAANTRRLRARALRLSKFRTADADDLFQETVLRAWKYRATFRPGTRFGSWMSTIMLNALYARPRSNEVEDVDGHFAESRLQHPNQEWRLRLREAAKGLSPKAFDVIMLLIEGFSYPEMAKALSCEVGTIKSRVSRARDQLVGHEA